ncbi:leucine dehydrogenase, partial [Mesorhizobium sp. M00.F.Ca.ET.186.01.1.1]
ILKVYEIAERDGMPSYKAADRMAEERIASVGKSRNTFLQNGKTVYHR